MKDLVIVESPTKARTISRFLGSEYSIKASMGHLVDLPKSKLGVDVDHNFKPQFGLMPDKEKTIKELKAAAKNARSIILATDPDREGEAIASHVAEMLKIKSKIKRIVFHEITKEAIEEALKNPRDIDINLVNAQIARRVLDRLVGYRLSPLLWQKIRIGLSAGRVQSVALRLIVEREREIEKFKKEGYWTINALMARAKSKSKEQNTEFELIEINGEKIELQKIFNLYDGEYKITKTIIENEKKAKEITSDLKKKQFIVSDLVKKETRRSPLPPFTTSTLQQDASHRFGYSGKRTMSLAQKLYEEGYISYHRTDSVNLSNSAISNIRKFIEKEYGQKFLHEEPRIYKTKQKLAQEAHEAIRPTKINVVQTTVAHDLGKDYARLYELIWKRAVASQMADAIIESTTVITDSKNHDQGKEKTYRLKASGSVLIFEGFLKINPQALEDKRLPEFIVSEDLNLINVNSLPHETLPPPRYNDASLIKTLEEKGIGRPSTYATIISTIENRRYIERNEGRFIPTPVGVAVNDFLVKNFSDVDDIPFTAQMEDELDNIANNHKDWVPMIKEFYKPFSEKVDKVKEEAKRVKIEVEKTDEKCEKCGAPLVIRIGKFGKFLACSRFPDCDFTKAFVEETNFTCPKCNPSASHRLRDDSDVRPEDSVPRDSKSSGQGGKIIIKKTKKGRKFYGCSNYPNCDFAAWKLEDIKKA